MRSRDWIWSQHSRFNPSGSGGHNWGLLSGFVAEADLLTPSMRKVIRFEGSFQRLDDLLKWTFDVIWKAYGTNPVKVDWPKIDPHAPSG